jgi:HSP20 family molecular chaperone IbpA
MVPRDSAIDGSVRIGRRAPSACPNPRHESWRHNYPPCNVERLSEDRYQISLAVAGFSPDEIAITAEQSVLTVEGRKAEKQQREFLYQGISSRPLKRQFSLADRRRRMTYWSRSR